MKKEVKQQKTDGRGRRCKMKRRKKKWRELFVVHTCVAFRNPISHRQQDCNCALKHTVIHYNEQGM